MGWVVLRKTDDISMIGWFDGHARVSDINLVLLMTFVLLRSV